MMHFYLLCLGIIFSLSSASDLSCATGLDGQERVIPDAWINDGYCDCPFDGKDEPNTEACSGSRSWPGLTKQVGGPASSAFVCTKQKNLNLPLSRVHDGICDCCDGQDEIEGLCPDVCDELFKEEREARENLQKSFKVGHNKRKHDLYNFKKLRQEKLKELEEKEAEIAAMSNDEAEALVDELRNAYVEERKSLASSIIEKLVDLVSALSEDELKKVIIHSCQLAGEVSEHDADACVALRLAALDDGMVWGDDDFSQAGEDATVSTDETEIAEILLQNSLGRNMLQWKQGESRRRLDEYSGDYDYDGEYNDDRYDEYDEDEDMHGNDDDMPPPRHDKYNHRPPASEVSEKEKEVIEELKAMKFSESRVNFLNRSKLVGEKINNILDTAESDEKKKEGDVNNEEKDGGDAVEDPEEAEAPAVDTEAYNAIKERLASTEKKISKGFRWGASAKLFFSTSPTSTVEGLRWLAIGTLMHGNLGVANMWEVLQSVLPEYALLKEEPTDTCAASLPFSCPPTVIKRGKASSYPPAFVITAIEDFCTKKVDEIDESTCNAEESSDAEELFVPKAVSDGLYGYFNPSPREESDPLVEFFTPLLSFKADDHAYYTLTRSISDNDSKKKRIEGHITNIYKDIGGKDGEGMGPDGELHSMANECFKFEAGKYTYETCIFEEAKQKEGSNQGGTGLGRWTGMEIEDDGSRVMKWENGAKCWNGPHRSATVSVTCGPETKLISADEPDTCRYVFEMESHIACDEAYKIKMGFDVEVEEVEVEEGKKDNNNNDDAPEDPKGFSAKSS